MSLLTTSSLISEISIGDVDDLHALSMVNAGPSDAVELLGNLNISSYYQLTLGSQNKSTRTQCKDKASGEVIYRYSLSRSGCVKPAVCELKLTAGAVDELKFQCLGWSVDTSDSDLKTLCDRVAGASVVQNQGQRARPAQAAIIGRTVDQFHLRAGKPRLDKFLTFIVYQGSRQLYSVTVDNTIMIAIKKLLDSDMKDWSKRQFERSFFRLGIPVPSIPCRSPILLFAKEYPDINIKLIDVTCQWVIGVTLAVKDVLKLDSVAVGKMNSMWTSSEAELVEKQYPGFIVAFLKYYSLVKTKNSTLCTKVFGLFWAANFNLENVLAIAKLGTGGCVTLRTIGTREYCDSGEYPRFNFFFSRKEWLKMAEMFETMATHLQTDEKSKVKNILVALKTIHMAQGLYLMDGKLFVSQVRTQARRSSQASKFDNNKKAKMLMAFEPCNILKFALGSNSVEHLLGAAITILTHVWPLRANSVMNLPVWAILSVFNVALKHPSQLYPMLYINTKLQNKRSSDSGEFIVVGTIDHVSLQVLMHCFSELKMAARSDDSLAKFFDCNVGSRRTITKNFMQKFLGSEMGETELCGLVNFNKAARAMFSSENCKRLINDALSKSDSKKQKKDGGSFEEHSLSVSKSNYTSWSIKVAEAARKRILECREILNSVKNCPHYISYIGRLDLDLQAERCRYLFNKMFGEDLQNAALCNWEDVRDSELWITLSE
jgi:hypothetical protein